MHESIIEEIIPIAVFLGHFQNNCENLKCEWFSGSQGYDAKIHFVNPISKKSEECYLEVSACVMKEDYLKREALDKGFPVFGGNNIKRENDIIVSVPVVNCHPDEIIKPHADLLRSRIKEKSKKDYPKNTFLIIPLSPDCPLMPEEKEGIIKCVYSEDYNGFCGIFIYIGWNHRNPDILDFRILGDCM